MSRIGQGILSGNPDWQKIPEVGSAVLILDPRYNKVVSGGFVDSIASRVGDAVYTAAGAARPINGGDFFAYDGVDDALLTPGTQGPGAGAVRYSVGFWSKSPAGVTVPWTLGGNFTLLIPSSPSDGWRWYDGGTTLAICGNSIAANQWGFFGITVDGTRALGSRARMYVGATAETVTQVATFSDTLPAACTGPAAAPGQGFQGSTKFVGESGLAGVWSGLELTQAQMRAFAGIRQPF